MVDHGVVQLITEMEHFLPACFLENDGKDQSKTDGITIVGGDDECIMCLTAPSAINSCCTLLFFALRETLCVYRQLHTNP
ncbi:hypothetical protein Tco_1098165 [Tanacetum coccineum]